MKSSDELPKSPESPNILLIISDQHRADTMGFSGGVDVKTPNIDLLAQTGVSFDRTITPSPLCGPARAAMFSGKYPHAARGRLNQDILGIRPEGNSEIGKVTDMMVNDSTLLEPPQLTSAFKEKGYYTAYAGKWHLGNSVINDWFDDAWGYDNQQYIDWCERNGIKEAWALDDPEVRSRRSPHMSIPKPKVNWNDETVLNDAWIADICLGYLKERPKNQSFFMVCGFNGPHPPFKIPEPYYSMYNPEAIPEPENFHPSAGEPLSKKRSFYRQLWQDHGHEWADWKKSVAVYRGYVSLIDHQIGRILETLENEGLRNQTLVIYCSDHGEMLGQHGLWHKMQPYEEAIRVPLIFSAPWIQQNKRVKSNTSLIDLPPTLVSMIGTAIPEDYSGSDLSHQILNSNEGMTPQFLISEHRPLGNFHGETEWRMVIYKHFKYIWNYGDKDEFYDLNRDPREVTNLIDAHGYGKELKILKNSLIKRMRDLDDPYVGQFERENEGKRDKSY